MVHLGKEDADAVAEEQVEKEEEHQKQAHETDQHHGGLPGKGGELLGQHDLADLFPLEVLQVDAAEGHQRLVPHFVKSVFPFQVFQSEEPLPLRPVGGVSDVAPHLLERLFPRPDVFVEDRLPEEDGGLGQMVALEKLAQVAHVHPHLQYAELPPLFHHGDGDPVGDAVFAHFESGRLFPGLVDVADQGADVGQVVPVFLHLMEPEQTPVFVVDEVEDGEGGALPLGDSLGGGGKADQRVVVLPLHRVQQPGGLQQHEPGDPVLVPVVFQGLVEVFQEGLPLELDEGFHVDLLAPVEGAGDQQADGQEGGDHRHGQPSFQRTGMGDLLFVQRGSLLMRLILKQYSLFGLEKSEE